MESKAKVAQRRKLKAIKNTEENVDNVEKNISKVNKTTFKTSKSRFSKVKNTNLSTVSVSKNNIGLSIEEIVVGTSVNVNMGTQNMPATIVEIHKDDVRVRLTNGLTMVVKAEHLRP